MPSEIFITVEESKLTLSGILDYDSVLAIDTRVREWLRISATQECCIDLGLVAYSNSAGLAMLLGWLRLARNLKKNLRILPLPKNLLDLAKVSGLDDLFQ